jgi:predicted nucleic acid-binding protein
MKTFVLDASVALGWTLDNPVPVSAAQAKQALLSGARALAPALWHLEIATGLAVAERRGILTASDATLALRQLEQLCAQALDIDADVVPLRQAWETARPYRLSAYDSVYLDLALRARLPLATLDVALRRAAGKAGVELLH